MKTASGVSPYSFLLVAIELLHNVTLALGQLHLGLFLQIYLATAQQGTHSLAKVVCQHPGFDSITI